MLKLLLICFLFLSPLYVIESQAAYNASTSCPKIQVCFTPGQDCTKQITNVLDMAKKSIFVQAYSFTSAPIAKHLAEAKNRGIIVKVILDKSQKSQSYSASRFLLNQHIPVWIDYKPAIAHNKIMIVDGKEVITGSFNFTQAAQYKNAENLLIIQDTTLAKRYMENWERRKMVSEVLNPNAILKKHKSNHHQPVFAFKF
ncbi:MAG: phospholipase D family protein [Pseudomonadota bacterium]